LRDIITVYAAGIAQGIALVTFPAASSVFISSQAYHLSKSEFGALFAPLALTAIAAALFSAILSKRLGLKRLLTIGLVANLASMLILSMSVLLIGRHAVALTILLMSTTIMGIGFGFTVPALNAIVAGLFPGKADVAVLALNALLGLGTALAPVFIALFVGLWRWWGLPITVSIVLIGLLVMAWNQPLTRDVPRHTASASGQARGGLPLKFWVFAIFMLLYGICETMNGTWITVFMSEHAQASAAMSAIALTVFWGMVTAGRVLFFLTERWLPEPAVFRLLPVMVIVSFTLDAVATNNSPMMGIMAAGCAGFGCSALLPLAISFCETDLPNLAAAVSGGLIAAYQVGYGIAAFGVGLLHDQLGTSFTFLFASAAVIAAAMALLSFPLTHGRSVWPTPPSP